MRIFLYISIMAVGAWIGSRDKVSNKLLSNILKLQTMSLLLLLFIMGINIGVNKAIVVTFYKIGYQALIISVSSILFSILGVKLVSGFLKGGVKEAKEDEC